MSLKKSEMTEDIAGTAWRIASAEHQLQHCRLSCETN
jgi:hypothetical protein